VVAVVVPEVPVVAEGAVAEEVVAVEELEAVPEVQREVVVAEDAMSPPVVEVWP
jgi:hypothetical protein